MMLKKRFGNDTDIHLHNSVLSRVTGFQEFYITEASEASSHLKPEKRLQKLSVNGKFNYHKIKVACSSLDDLYQGKIISTIDLLKIDMQGAELEVLKGAEQLLTE